MSATAADTLHGLPGTGNLYGGPLTAQDYRDLAARWIDREHAGLALLSRVPDHVGRDLVCQRRKNCDGILIPYLLPGDGNQRSCRIRRDHPEIENGKPKDKYMQPPGGGNRLYFTIPTTAAELEDIDLPIIITEGEFKAIALGRLAVHNATGPRFLAVGVPGVWNWRGTIGKTSDAKGARVDEKGPIPDLGRIAWSGRRVVIAFDADATGNSKVKAARYQLSQELRSRGAVVGTLEWDLAAGKGIDDWLAAAGPEAVLRAIDSVDFNRTTGWKAKLKCSEAGKPKPLLMNADIALRTAQEWEGVLAFDEFRQKVRIVAPAPIGGPVPRDWSDADDTKAAIWAQQQGIELGRDIIGTAVQSVALDCPIHPLRDWLDSIQWDGTRRVDTWLTEYLSAAPSEYVSAVGRLWMISAVARVMKPGCQADYCLILEGEQGVRKSTAIRVLAGEEYFTDQMPDLHSKDAQLQTAGAWIVEFGELDSFRRNESETLKAFITRRVERFRPPYGKHLVDVPRQCVFAGSTNRAEYLADETGNRRFWPVRCGEVNIERLKLDREQLWAEAVALYKEGASWWPERAEMMEAAKTEQAARLSMDPWQETVETYVTGAAVVRAEDILKVLKPLEGTWQQADRNRIGRCLRVAGFEPSRTRLMGRCYVRMEGK